MFHVRDAVERARPPAGVVPALQRNPAGTDEPGPGRLMKGVRIAIAVLMILGLAGPRVIGRAAGQAEAYLVGGAEHVAPTIVETQLAVLPGGTCGLNNASRAETARFVFPL